MRLEDIKIGMRLVDKYGNEYEVNKLTEDKQMPVKLKCTKFVREIPVQNLGGIKFREAGQSFYVNDFIDIGICPYCSSEPR